MKIDINQKLTILNDNKIQIDGDLTKDWILSLLAEGYTTYDIISSYEISEDVLLDSLEFLDKNVLIDGLNFSGDFIEKALHAGYITQDDIYDLSLTTYSNLSDSFIEDHKDNINWDRMILYIATQSDQFDKYVDIIDSKNLWNLISANDLSIEFIREHKDKLNWIYLSMVKNFTDDEKNEFSDYIVAKQIVDELDDFYNPSISDLDNIINVFLQK